MKGELNGRTDHAQQLQRPIETFESLPDAEFVRLDRTELNHKQKTPTNGLPECKLGLMKY